MKLFLPAIALAFMAQVSLAETLKSGIYRVDESGMLNLLVQAYEGDEKKSAKIRLAIMKSDYSSYYDFACDEQWKCSDEEGDFIQVDEGVNNKFVISLSKERYRLELLFPVRRINWNYDPEMLQASSLLLSDIVTQ